MPGFPTVNFGESEKGLFSTEEIQRLMRVEHARAVRYAYPLTLMLIEIDRLESLHDLYGVESKQAIRRSVTTLLRSSVRSSDVLGCLRDERMMAAFPHTTPESALALARRLLRGCRELAFKSDGRSLRATLSIGIAQLAHEEPGEFERLVSEAEEALAAAVAGGGDRSVEHANLPRRRETARPAQPGPRAHVPRAPIPALPAAAPPTPARAPALPPLPGYEELEGLTATERIKSLFRALGPRSKETEALEREVIAAVEASLREARSKSISAEDRERHVELLERRLAKLKQMLEATEEELARLIQEKGVDPGIASIYRQVQGLVPEARDYRKKRELLGLIYQANVELLKQIKSSG